MVAAERDELMDRVSKAILETVGGAGFVVSIGWSEGKPVVEAIREGTGERFVVRSPHLCIAVVELAE